MRSMRLAFASLLAVTLLNMPLGVRAEDKAPDLAGTYWHLLSLTQKGEKITDAMSPASVDFLKDGKWTVLHASGRLEGGTWKVADGKLTMKNEGGEVYQDGKMTWKAADKIIEVDDGKWLWRIRQAKK